MRAFTQLAFGLAFGLVLARNGAADFDAMNAMFLFRSLHLFGLAMVSTALTAAGLAVVRHRTRRGVDGRIRWTSRPVHRGTVVGAVLFGIGWGVSGSCPGTALVQIGQGYLVSIATVAGILLGALLYSVVNRRYLHLGSQSCD